VYSERSLVSIIGVSKLAIADTLVADKARAEEVSHLVEHLRQSNCKEYAQYLRNYRPWGYCETLSAGERFQVKHLHVKHHVEAVR
jgi:hypothetical protein